MFAIRVAIALLLLPPYSLADNRACTGFQWVTDRDGAEKSAMVVTATVGGHAVDLQFDTGSDVSVLYGNRQAAELGLSVQRHASGQQTARALLTAGDIEFAAQTFHIVPYPAAGVAGRIGLRSLLGNIVRIDYPNQQICLLSELEYLLARGGIQQVPAQIRSGKLFLDIRVNQRRGQLFFDTGASLYPLLVDRAYWRQLTGRQGHEPENTRIQGWANGRLVTTVGAPLQGHLQLGELRLPAPRVHFIRERPNYFAEHPVPAAGLLGNALFFNRTLILDLRRQHTWFGISKVGITAGF